MIIQCDQCHTRFKIDDSKVTEKGVKVRCKKCRNIFSVKKPVEEKAQESFEDLHIDEDLFPSEEDLKESGQPKREKEEELSLSEETAGGTSKEEEASKGAEEETLLTGGEEEEEETGSAGFDIGGDDFQFSFESDEEAESLSGKAPVSETTEVDEKVEEEVRDETSEHFGLEETASESAEDSAQALFHDENEETIGDITEGYTEETLIPAGIKGSWSSMRRYIIIILFLIFLGVAGLFFWGGAGSDVVRALDAGFSRILELIGGNKGENVSLGLLGLKGYLQDNSKTGRFFVIEGRVVNPSNDTRKIGRIKGTLFDKKGKPVQARPIKAGKLLTKEQLSVFSREQIERNLRNAVDTIKPGASLPFMVVFYQVPSNLSEFLVEVEER